MKKSILVIGAGLNQLNLIRSAKELGYTTVVVDIVDDSPGKELSDFFYVLPGTDFEGHCKLIEKHDVKGIVSTQMDKPLQFMAKLASKYGFNFPTEQSILWARNKFLMKQRFLENGVACSKGILIHTKEELTEQNLSSLKFPLMIKPVDAFSSRGVYKVNDLDEIKKQYEITKTFSSDGTVILEEFIGGNMISAEGFVFKNKPTIIQYTERYKFTAAPRFVELGHLQPAKLSEEETKNVEKLITDIVKALQINNCGFHAELKLTNNGPYIIEIGARLGGDFNGSHLVFYSTGINIEKIIAMIAMGEEPTVPTAKHTASMIKYVEYPEKKKVKKINTIVVPEEFKESVIEHVVMLKENEEIPLITDSAKRRGYVITKGKTREEAIKVCLAMETIMLNAIEYF